MPLNDSREEDVGHPARAWVAWVSYYDGAELIGLYSTRDRAVRAVAEHAEANGHILTADKDDGGHTTWESKGADYDVFPEDVLV